MSGSPNSRNPKLSEEQQPVNQISELDYLMRYLMIAGTVGAVLGIVLICGIPIAAFLNNPTLSTLSFVVCTLPIGGVTGAIFLSAGALLLYGLYKLGQYLFNSITSRCNPQQGNVNSQQSERPNSNPLNSLIQGRQAEFKLDSVPEEKNDNRSAQGNQAEFKSNLSPLGANALMATSSASTKEIPVTSSKLASRI